MVKKKQAVSSQDAADLVAVVDRRLEGALSIWPFLRDEPEKWRILASFLVSDKKIWGVLEGRITAKPRGAPKKVAGESKYSLGKLRHFARAFKHFETSYRAKRKELGIPLATQDSLIRDFRKKEGKRFPWLPKEPTTVKKILQQANRTLDFPIVRVEGRWQVLHPDVAAAYHDFLKVPQCGGAEAAKEVLKLRHDRPGDKKEMAAQRSFAVLRHHGIHRALGISQGLFKESRTNNYEGIF